MSEPVEAYFSQLRDIRASGAGVAEISYYGPLAALLDEVGKGLKPKVRALMQLRNTGSGNPDGGLFAANQLKGWEPGVDPLAGQLPGRGAIEVKGTGDDVFAVAVSEQVARYVERYGLVLVTNLRDFVLVGRDAAGSGVRTLESCRLAETEAGFWGRVAQPRKFAAEAGEGLTEFLRRVLLHNAPLTDPKDVAWFLASYARTARLRLEQKHELPALDALRGQLEDSLGLKFEGEKGDHFFRSTLVQTLFYGMFASWVLWARDRDHATSISWDQRFQWETATATLHVPMVYELFRQFADVRQLGALGISEVLEWAEEVIWRVDRPAFFEKFREDHAVQYFYEPFLEAFDPQLRKELGVWYTPDEVVKYMVARVDTVLREELGIADGLADPSVVVLDPCCGTGAYLVEVLRKIDETLQAKGADALTRQDVKRAAMDRVIGFEIMPAPFVVAHLQLGILLAELGVPLRDADERAAVYLTNALTGWGSGEVVPPKDKRVGPGQLHSTVLFPEFAEERDAADRIKREEQILVVIGNPPYNGFAGVAQDEEADLIEPYKRGLASEWGITKNYLDDPYIRFFRLAERAIANHRGKGVVSLVSTFSYVADPTYVQMRRHLLSSFDSIWIDSLNGDSRKTGKTTPEGLPDPSVFSTPRNREGIRVGTAIATMVRTGDAPSSRVEYRDFWGAAKKDELVASLHGWPGVLRYEMVNPSAVNRFALRPTEISDDYLSWVPVDELSRVAPQLGLNENRGGGLQGKDRDSVLARVAAFIEGTGDENTRGLGRVAAGYEPGLVREAMRSLPERDRGHVLPYLVRPFDQGWAFVSSVRGLWNRPRPQLQRWIGSSGAFLLTRPASAVRDEGMPAIFTRVLGEQDLLRGHAYYFPFAVPMSASDGAAVLPGLSMDGTEPNLSPRGLRWLDEIGFGSGRTEVWFHVLSVLYSDSYLRENAAAVAGSWPRVPLPADPMRLVMSIDLGKRVADLLEGSPRATSNMERRFGVLSSASGQLDPAADLGVLAHWGIVGKGGITMPSTGKLTERDYSVDERAAIAESLGMSAESASALLGDTCFDVYLNDVAYWRCVPANVWRYTIGGYQVIKKWLSYRERVLLGRDLKPEEARYVTEMVRRITALVLMQPELDANYERVKADVWDWCEAKAGTVCGSIDDEPPS